MQALLTTYFDYHWEANERYINLLNEVDSPPKHAIALMSHILNAHLIWLNRIRREGTDVGAWDEQNPADMTELNLQCYKRSIALLAEAETDEVIHYKNTKGESFSNTIQDILLHIVNHGTYHRGQLAWLLRKADIAPPNSDYIFYRREDF